jgi:hypothetical protein
VVLEEDIALGEPPKEVRPVERPYRENRDERRAEAPESADHELGPFAHARTDGGQHPQADDRRNRQSVNLRRVGEPETDAGNEEERRGAPPDGRRIAEELEGRHDEDREVVRGAGVLEDPMLSVEDVVKRDDCYVEQGPVVRLFEWESIADRGSVQHRPLVVVELPVDLRRALVVRLSVVVDHRHAVG